MWDSYASLTTRCGRRVGQGPSNGTDDPGEPQPEAHHGSRGSGHMGRDGSHDRSRR